MRIEGQLLDVQRNSGNFADKQTGEVVNWENVVLSVFDGREVVKIKAKGPEAVASALGLSGARGQVVTLDVDSVREVQTRTLVAVGRKQ